MPNITNPEAVALCNNTVRPAADALCRCYYFGNLAAQMYNAAGGGATALAVPGIVTQIRNKAAEQWRVTFAFCYEREREWFLKGGGTLFPNDTSPVFDNGGTSQRTDAPLATGAKVVAVMARVTEFINAILSPNAVATDQARFSDVTRSSFVYYNRQLIVSLVGLTTFAVGDAQNFVDMTAAQKVNYEAASLQNLNSLLAMAVNPGN